MDIKSVDIINYITGENTSDVLKQKIDLWIKDSPSNLEEYNLYNLIYNQRSILAQPTSFSRDGDWENLLSRVGIDLEKDTDESTSYVRWIIGLLLIIALGIAAYFYFRSPLIIEENLEPLAELKTTTLPDGSTVQLFKGAEVKYKRSLASDDQRMVYLTGDATFDIAHDPDRPFVVEVNGAAVEVLGTIFEIVLDPTNNNATITNKEGKVNCYEIVKPTNNQILKKGDKVVWDGSTFDYTPAYVPPPPPIGENKSSEQIIDFLATEELETIVEFKPYMSFVAADSIFFNDQLSLEAMLDEMSENGRLQYIKLPRNRYQITQIKAKL